MRGIQHRLLPVIAAPVACDFYGAIQDANLGVGSDQGQRKAHGFWRDGVVIEIEADINGLCRVHIHDAIGVGRMKRQRQQSCK